MEEENGADPSSTGQEGELPTRFWLVYSKGKNKKEENEDSSGGVVSGTVRLNTLDKKKSADIL